MGKDFKGYYEYLKWELDKYKGSYDEYIFHLPDYFKLLSDTLSKDIAKNHRLMIAATLGYLVAPKDVINEEVYGPAGYVDDIFLCCYMLKKIKKEYGLDFINELWDSKQDFESVFKIAYNKSSKIINEKKLKKNIFQYVGLK